MRKIDMRIITVVALISAGICCLYPVSVWGMIASNPGNMGWRIMESRAFVLSLGTSLEIENGDMTYAIQGLESGGWKSELEWPLENIIYLGGIVSARFWDRFQLNGGLWKSLNDDAGTMKDSDWFFRYFGNQRAIYSETEGTVNATHLDVNFRCDMVRSGSIAVGAVLGYSYIKWDWEAGNGYQTTLDPYNFYMGPIQGTAITYEEKVKVPYIGVAVSLFPPNSAFGMNVYTLYTTKAQCDDVDDHVLREKKATGETEGSFLSLGGDVLWNFSKSWSLTGRMNYTKYDLEGEQDQVGYGGDLLGWRSDDIDLTVEGSQVYFGCMVSYNL